MAARGSGSAPPNIELVDAGEIAERLNLRHRNVVLDWRLHRFHFPAPVMRRRTYLWDWAEVEQWSAEHANDVLAMRARRQR
jgi:hypothetical protein